MVQQIKLKEKKRKISDNNELINEIANEHVLHWISLCMHDNMLETLSGHALFLQYSLITKEGNEGILPPPLLIARLPIDRASFHSLN